MNEILAYRFKRFMSTAHCGRSDPIPKIPQPASKTRQNSRPTSHAKSGSRSPGFCHLISPQISSWRSSAPRSGSGESDRKRRRIRSTSLSVRSNRVWISLSRSARLNPPPGTQVAVAMSARYHGAAGGFCSPASGVPVGDRAGGTPPGTPKTVLGPITQLARHGSR